MLSLGRTGQYLKECIINTLADSLLSVHLDESGLHAHPNKLGEDVRKCFAKTYELAAAANNEPKEDAKERFANIFETSADAYCEPRTMTNQNKSL